MKLWLVQQYRDGEYEIQGVFDSFELAAAACLTDQWTVCGPLTLNEGLPLERGDWLEQSFPRAAA